MNAEDDGILVSAPMIAQAGHYQLMQQQAQQQQQQRMGGGGAAAATAAAATHASTALTRGSGGAPPPLPLVAAEAADAASSRRGSADSASASAPRARTPAHADAAAGVHDDADGQPLSARAPSFASLHERELLVFDAEPAVYTSTLPRTLQTVAPLPFNPQPMSALNPMETGICLGIPLQHLASQFPGAWGAAAGGEGRCVAGLRSEGTVVHADRSRARSVVLNLRSSPPLLQTSTRAGPPRRTARRTASRAARASTMLSRACRRLSLR